MFIVKCFCYSFLARGAGCNNCIQLICCGQGGPGETEESEGRGGESWGENKPQRAFEWEAQEVPLPAEEDPLN